MAIKVKHTKTTVTHTKKKSPNRCPTCGKYMKKKG